MAMKNTNIKFAVSVFKNEEPIRAELWDYENGFETAFLNRIARTLLGSQTTLTLMINQTLFVKFISLGGGDFMAKYNVNSAKKEQRFSLLGEHPQPEEIGLKLLNESFQVFINDILNTRSKQ